jgi:predicted HicB family RNase H-like nuclease
MNNKAITYRGYDGSVLHDPEDNLYHGKILGIRDMVIYHGETPEEAEHIFHQAVDEYIAHFESDGVTPPDPYASFSADLPRELKVKAALYAHEHDTDPEKVLQTALANFLEKAA